MSITYPLTLPTVTGIRSITLRSVNAVAIEQSPFTFAQQVQASSGQRWEADVTLPPMKRESAATWVSWLRSLRGQYGTFLMGDPLCATPRGTAGGTPIITNQSGGTIIVTGAAVSQTGWLLSGDYIQIGTGSSATLHMVLQDVDTDGSGNAAVEVWPHVRGTRSGTVTVSNAVGRFRLSDNMSDVTIDSASTYGISFSAMEAI